MASLVGNGSVLAGGPQDVIRTVLGGIEAKGTDAPMPAVGSGMTDQQIADVTNYVRQAWGNNAPPNAARRRRRQVAAKHDCLAVWATQRAVPGDRAARDRRRGCR